MIHLQTGMPSGAIDSSKQTVEADLLEQFAEEVSEEDFAGILSVWDQLPAAVVQACCNGAVIALPPKQKNRAPSKDILRRLAKYTHMTRDDLRAVWPRLGHKARWNVFYGVRRYFSDTRPVNCQFPVSEAMCWNYMTPYQQAFLMTMGRIDRLPWKVGYGGGPCRNRAEVGVKVGSRPGPRFYCRECAKAFPASDIVESLPDVA